MTTAFGDITIMNRRTRNARHARSWMLFCFATILAILAISMNIGDGARVAAQAPPSCTPPNGNPIACENALAGNPASEWDVAGAGDPTIQGFSTDISVNRGQTVSFKIDTDATNYRLDIYRMGYYGGMGARKVATVTPSVSLPQIQPDCLSDDVTGLIDCGNWSVSATWTVPSSAASGIYFARARRTDNGGSSHIVFIVRDDASQSGLVFQTSDTTWQAYNQYGGNSLYVGAPGTNPGRAYKVSYNRPFTTRETSPEDWVFNAEYPMVRWLEANGYDVSYATGVDSDRNGARIQQHKIFLSVGHDEYWSGAQRTNVEAARAAGVNLAFFSGNEIFWKTRWENSISAPATSYRTLVSYKETHANAKIDPAGTTVWTGTWADPRFSPPADGGRPQNALSGTEFTVNCCTDTITVPAADGKMRFWRNTAVANQPAGSVAALTPGTLGYEWDSDLDNGFRPAGLFRMSDTTVSEGGVLLDYGSTYGSGVANHALTMYRHASGARVFGAGTVQWSWGLDNNHDRGNDPADVSMQQATINLFADMGVQPLTVLAGLVTAAPSTDTLAPQSVVTTPNGNTVPANTTITLAGTAADSGGGQVAGVEVSVDGGVTWHPATGRSSWTFAWQTGAARNVTVFARAVDDSGNLEHPTTGRSYVVGGTPACPCSLWLPSQGPSEAPQEDSNAVELGTRFKTDINGFVTAIRFYKSPNDIGPHTGTLWTAAGAKLATVAFTNESASGWQQATLGSSVAVSAGGTYVVSFHTDAGNYYQDDGYFLNRGVDNGPLHAPQDGTGAPNGVFHYGSSAFPANPSSGANYWTDVVLASSGTPDTTPPTVNAVNPGPGVSGVQTNTIITIAFNEPMLQTSISGSTIELRNSSNTLIASTVTFDQSTWVASLRPTAALANSSTYTARVHSGTSGVKDLAGNPLQTDYAWSFTTSAPLPPPDSGPGGPILIVTGSANPFTKYYAEILRAEGFNAFQLADLSTVTATTLASYDVVILGEMSLTSTQATMFTTWVNAGGRLIAMRPDVRLASLLGISSASGTLSDAYMQVNATTAPGAGIVAQTMQFHGTADRYTSSGATVVATLFSNATTSTSNPAVTVRSVGTSGGQAGAFTYDLARSVVYTRQGNPAWSGQERDAQDPIRSDDLFFGGTQPNYVDLSKVAIPQADEQQRLLANLINFMNSDRKPLPKFWYLPRGSKAAVVMTGDDHANGGTAGRFDIYNSVSPVGCVVDNWECVRGTSYIFANTPISPTQVASYVSQGFEIGVHMWMSGLDEGSTDSSMNCNNFTPQSIAADYVAQIGLFGSQFPFATPVKTNRTHCIVWSDYTTQAQVAFTNGIRLDTNYYYWPASWVNDVPGLFTGSGMPMRFAKTDGTMIDVYQATSQMTDESGQTFPKTVDALLDRALGPEGYYGTFVANMHTDTAVHAGSEAIVASAQTRGVPIISAKQLLDWLDGRNSSFYSGLTWSGSSLVFSVSADSRAKGLRMLVPAASAGRVVTSVTRDGQPVPFAVQTLKGLNYITFDSGSGNYNVLYATDGVAPTITSVVATPDATSATITWNTNELANSQVSYGTNPSNLTVSAGSTDAVTAHTVRLSGLAPGTNYYYRVASRDLAGNSATAPIAPAPPAGFTTPIAPNYGCPCSIWTPSQLPSQASVSDATPVELGLKFSPTASGYITGIRFYKGPLNGGTHTGTLWSVGGVPLATVAFTNESATGWQQAILSQPVAVTANAVYVVSYHTNTGGYAADLGYFQTGVTSGPLRALAEGVSGSNGVYAYGTGGFPTSSFSSANYWVDVVFVTTLPPAPPAPSSVTDTTVADFAGGTLGSGLALGQSADGEVVLASNSSEEFSGGALPAGWSSTPWTAGGATIVANGSAVVDGALLGTDATLPPSQSLEFHATFSGDAYQHAGFALTFNENLWAMFSTGSGGQLLARTHDGTSAIDTPIPGNWLGAAHQYRIDWTATSIVFSIDGNPVATNPAAISAEMRPVFSDFSAGGGGIVVDWMRLGPYATSGTFTSRVLDAGAATNWASATSTVSVPSGSVLTLGVRFGNTPTPDGTWSSFTSIPTGNATISASSRYVQYTASFSGTGADTPGLEAITFGGPGAPNLPSISVADTAVAEGTSTTNYAVFTVTLSAPFSSAVTVSYDTAPGTASATDFTASSGTVTFPAGSTSALVLVPIVPDAAIEPSETFTLTLSNPVNATLARGQAVGTIINDDFPVLSINNVTVTEGNAGAVNAVFTVTMSLASFQDIAVNYTTANGTAVAPADYSSVSGTLTIPAGATTGQIDVPVIGDILDEANETFTVALSSPVNATLGTSTGIGTIADDDPTPTLAINDVTVAEGNTGTTNAVFTVTLSVVSGQTVTVNYATANGTASSSSDYSSRSGTLTFPAGTTTQTITVPVTGDTLDEPNETFVVNLSGATNATIADSQGAGTIVDDDLPALSINNVTVTEGNTGSVNAVFAVSLSSAGPQPITVTYATANGTAVAPGDYTATSGTLTFATGVTSQTVTVPVVGDTLDEANETFVVNLSGATNATIADSQGVGTITDDDPSPTLAINDVTVTEGNTGTINAVFTVTLSAVSGQTVTVNYATANGTASSSTDYSSRSGTLTFPAGTTTQTITVPVTGDTLDEPNETFVVNLSGATNATIADSQGVGTIVDDDPPALSINDVTVTEGNTGTVNAVFTVALSSAGTQPITVNYTTANGTAIAPGDYTARSGTLTFATGVTSQTITVPVVGDTLDEANETFVVNLSGATNATIADSQGVGTITDNDPSPTLAINDVTVTEGNTGTANAVFTVTLSAVSGQTVTVNYATANGTAVAPGDYTATSGTLTFAVGVTRQTITVPVVGDTLDEANETFVVNLSGATNATIADSQGVGTITDNDPTPSLVINNVSVTEGNTGTQNAVFTVTLSAASGQTVTVNYATANGTATAGSDYAARSGSLTFNPGTTTQTIPIAINGDTTRESNETYFVNLSGATNATIADNQGVGTIVNND